MRKFKHVYRFRIVLEHIRPPIWRQIQVPETYTFWDLHVAIQDAMGWYDYHLHEFNLRNPSIRKRVRIGIPDDEGWSEEEILPGWDYKIAAYFTMENARAGYVYDFGDNWEHTIQLEGIGPREEGVSYPRCIAGKRACPPEDCGGVSGYERILAGEPEWTEAYAGFDSEAFDCAAVRFDDPDSRWKMAFLGEETEEQADP